MVYNRTFLSEAFMAKMIKNCVYDHDGGHIQNKAGAFHDSMGGLPHTGYTILI